VIVVKVTKITAKQAEAFRERLREQNERIAKMVILDLDEAINLFTETADNEASG